MGRYVDPISSLTCTFLSCSCLTFVTFPFGLLCSNCLPPAPVLFPLRAMRGVTSTHPSAISAPNSSSFFVLLPISPAPVDSSRTAHACIAE